MAYLLIEISRGCDSIEEVAFLAYTPYMFLFGQITCTRKPKAVIDA